MPTPAECAVTDILYRMTDEGVYEPFPNCPVTIIKVRHSEAFFSTERAVVRADENGLVTLRLPQSSTVWVYAEATNLNASGGVRLTIPAAASATLFSLVSAASVPASGLVVQRLGSHLLNREGTLNFNGSYFGVTETTPGTAAVTISVFGPSGPAHAPGLVPDPGPVAGAARFLCEDGTWQEPAGGGSGLWGGITGTLSDQVDLQSALDAKAPTSHAHAIADVTGLQSALNGKAALSHTHAQSDVTNLVSDLAAKQPLDATLTALAAFNSNGVIVQTATDTFAARTLTGTANRLTVANGNGAGGNPTFNIDTTLLPSPVLADAGKFLKATAADAYAPAAIAIGDVTSLQAALDAKQNSLGFTPENAANKDQASGYAGLDGAGKINPSHLPAIAISSFLGSVASQAAMLALSGERGDWCVRTDVSATYILIADDASQLASWQIVVTPLDAVSSIFGRTGAVTAQNNDYTWAQINKTTSSLADITTRSASDLSSGTLPLARLSGITNTEIASGAAIAYSKLNLSASIVNADVASGAAIALSKLASGSSIVTSVVNDTNVTGSVSANALTLGWSGALSKARQHAATAYTDQANTFTVAQTLPLVDKAGQLFNVKAFGALGNGSTDDLAALQAADAAAAAVGGIVYLPPGTYAISAPFLPSEGVTVLGAGRKASFLKALAGFDSGLAESQLIAWNGLSYITISDIGFVSNGQNAQGFKIEDSINSTVRNCHFDSGCQRMGIIGGTTTQNITITHNVSEGTTLAENLAIVDACYCEVSFNHIKQPTTSNIFNGVEFFLVTPGAMVGNKIIGNTFENSGTAGVAAGGDVQTTVAGNTFVSCNYALLGDENAGTPSVGGTFSGNVIISPVSAAVLFQSAHDWTVSANTVRGSAGAGMIIGGTGHVIEGNSVVGSASVGFSILGSYNTVTGNSAVDNSRGFGVSGDSNAIHDNVATDTRTPKVQDFGLVFTSGADNNIYGGNMLTGNLNGTISDAGSGNLSAVKTGDSPRFATVTVTANLTKDATKLYLDLDTSGVTGFPSADFVFGGGGIFRVAKVSVVGTNDIFFQALPPSSAGFGIIETYGGAGTGLSTGGPGQPILMLPNRTERGRFDDNGLSVTGILSVSPNYPNGLKFDSSTLMYGGSSNFTFYDFSQNNARIGNVGVRLASNRQLAWANTNDATQAADTGLDRNAAGVVEVNNGTPGTLRDFKARAINLSSLTPSGSADSTGNQGDFRWDDSFVYVKTSGGWKRSALSTF